MKTIVVEDSRLAREGLVKMLAAFPSLQVVGAADHPETARQLIREHRPDLIFLDIHMPGENGFELLESLDYSPRIIFTTAYSEFAIRSFEFNTIDYLLKPISHERLAYAIEKLSASSKDEGEAGDASRNAQAPLEINSRVFVKDGDKCHLVALQDIRYFESCKNYVRIFFGNNKAYIKKSLNVVEERLPKKYFFRVNRQYIVNLHDILRIEEAVNDGYEITMSDNNVIQISRRNASELKDLLSL